MKKSEFVTRVSYDLVRQHMASGLTPQDCTDIGLVPIGKSIEEFTHQRLHLDRSLQPKIWRRLTDRNPSIKSFVPEPTNSPFWFSESDETKIREDALQENSDTPSIEKQGIVMSNVNTWVGHFMDQWFEEQETDYGTGHNQDKFRGLLGEHLQWINIKSLKRVDRNKQNDALPLRLDLISEDDNGDMYRLSMILTAQERIRKISKELFSDPMTEFTRTYISSEISRIQRRLLSKLKADIDAAAQLKYEHTQTLSEIGNSHALAHLINLLYTVSQKTGGGDLLIRYGDEDHGYENRLFFRNDEKGISFYWKNTDEKEKNEFDGARITCSSTDNTTTIKIDNPSGLRQKNYQPDQLMTVLGNLTVVGPETFSFYRVSGKGSTKINEEYHRWLGSITQLSLAETLDLFRYNHDGIWSDVSVSFHNDIPVIRGKTEAPLQTNN